MYLIEDDLAEKAEETWIAAGLRELEAYLAKHAELSRLYPES